jgi:hypothetical protein
MDMSLHITDPALPYYALLKTHYEQHLYDTMQMYSCMQELPIYYYLQPT